MRDRGSPLIILQQAPHATSLAIAALDMVMSFAVFAQSPRVLFSGPAVLCLAPQQAGADGQKSLRKIIESLPLYDVETIYVDELSLGACGFNHSDLPDFAEVLDKAALAEMRSEAAFVVSL